MKKPFLVFLTLLFLLVAAQLGSTYWKAKKSSEENNRIRIMLGRMDGKLADYKYAHGEFPLSLGNLSFSSEELEQRMTVNLSKFAYQRTKSGYFLSYRDDEAGHWQGSSFGGTPVTLGNH